MEKIQKFLTKRLKYGSILKRMSDLIWIFKST